MSIEHVTLQISFITPNTLYEMIPSLSFEHTFKGMRHNIV